MSPLNRKLIDGRLAAYATLAGVALAAPAIPTADAAIIYSGPVNINIPSSTSGVYLNVVTGLSATTPSGAVGWDVNPWSSSTLSMFGSTSAGGNEGPGALNSIGAYVGTGSTFFNLAFGATIDGSTGYGATGNNTIAVSTPLNLNSNTNYVGFRFFNEATATVDYGWMQISLSATAAGQPRAIIAYGYQNDGTGITAGAIPEPTTMTLLGVMAAGAFGVRAWRKRKAA